MSERSGALRAKAHDDGSEEAPTLPDTAEAVAPNDAVAAVEGSDNLDGDAPGHSQ